MSDSIDVVMATYNGEKYVREQIQSILHQSKPPVHLWIRDDLSTDRTPSILLHFQKKYPNLITVIPSTTKLGVKGNFSALLQEAKSDYVMLSDQDDFWLPHKVEVSFTEMKKLEANYGKSIPLCVHTDLNVVDVDLNRIHPSFWSYSHFYPKRSKSLNKLLVQNVVTGCTVLVNRALLNKALPIPHETLMHDWWLGLVAASFGQIGVVDQPTLLYRQHSQNLIGAKHFGSFRHLKLSVRKLFEDNAEKMAQAQVFFDRYATSLPLEHRQMLEVYLNMRDVSYFKSRSQILKYGFFKNGLLRNIASFFFQRQP